MTVIELLSRLRDLGITITADGDRLRVNAARGTLTPELRDALTSHKGQLLELLRTQVTDNGEAPITRVPRDQPNPLSFAQERLWFLDQLTPGGTAYSIPFFLRLEGPLDVDALHRALQEIVVRHEALRTAFPAVHGEPRQVILDDFELPLPIERLDGTREEREATAHRLATEEILRPFDLARGPLVRARLLHVDDQDHVLLLALHHAAIDIWSIGLLRNELSTLYEAFREDRASPLEPLPVQYVDFAAWQRRHLDDAVIAGHLAWWEPRLAGAETLALPTDHPRPAVQSFAGGHHRSTVPGPVLDGLRRLAREEKASVFMVTLAAFQLLLHHYCGQDDIVIGTTVVNRDREEIKSLIGFFSNTLVMRGNFGGNRTFRSLLRETRETALGAYAHQALPFETLVNKLQPVRDLSRNPIFQVFFAQLNTEPIASDAPRGTGGMRLADLTVTSFAHGKTPTHFDLELDVDESATGLVTRYVYSRDLFDAATIERMDRHYQNLLAAIVAAPDQPAGTLPIMEDAERTEVLDAWNATDAPFAADRCIHELFEAQVRRTPQQTAVVFEGESLTYDELNAAANRIAHSLRRHGVGPEVPVAICMERSIEMVVALLGVLKAGGAYVPLDPGHPPARLGFMIEDTGAAVVLTRSHLAESLGDAVPLVCLDDAASDLAGESAERLPREGDPDALAYVLYTSGSTGRPKGVGVTHRGLVNYLSWCADAYGLASGEVALVHSPITFDLTVTGLLAPLTVGGRVRLVPEAHGVEGLAQAIRAEDAVGLVKITPAHLQLLGGQLDATERRRVRTFVIGGESLTAEHVSAWMDGATRLINEYGPTETVVGACVHDVVADDLARSSIPIGRPLANARIYVLDKRMAPVPIGIPGEIYIGGAGVARGYVNRPALTAERFVPDPFAAEPGARLYRTGDLARHLPDGGLEFLGRRDEQVKVRGYRIELGEIEGVLLEHDAVTQAVAMVREDRPGDRTLVAYVVGADAPSAGAMRSFLKDRLPEYMVPASFVTLDAMPLTPNGKVDRRALPAPGGERQVADAYLAPRGERQEQIAAIWCDVLALEKVGVRDNFFDLGGHSLLVVRVHARLVEELECDLTVTDLFQYPTIEKLSRRLRGEGGSETLARQAVRRFPRRHTTETESVAVIAMVGRFPGANSIDELWKNLRNGVEGIHRFSDDELREIGVPEHLIAHPDYVKARGVIDDIDRFDAWFFGYNPREAELIDPQHRIFLECAWEALETAGYDPERYHGAIGVYAGTKANTYENIVRTRPDLMAAGGNLPQLTGDSDFLATRVAYKLNLRGPSMNVQTACSTSLVAIHEACRALLDYQCDMALAGGVSLTRPIAGGYIYEEGGIQSPDGHCRVFDARAQGTVAADGAAIVVLKRLDDAIADGDQIHAVVRGTAVNNDGSLKVGFTAPSVDGQAEVISLAHARAGVEPDAIGYVEAHGTGTVLGDPIEVAALKQAFRRATARQGFCALGAIKSNLGHLNHAAGVAGFIKAALSVEHGEIPPSLHFERPNPELGIEQSPFFVNTELRAWTGDGKRPRLSAVSSFGIGGTNAHVILEEAPPLEPAGAARPSQLLVLSARNASGLEAAAQNLAAHLRSNEDQTLADVAYTLQVGRRQFEHRRAVLGRNAAEVVEALDGNAPDRTWTQHAEAREHPVAFLFPGQGAQYVDMARDLYRDEAAFRATVDACVAGLDGELDFDLRKLLYPDAETVADDASERLTRTSVAQPALFVVEYALAQLWRSWGIEPSVMIGHSSGEYVAACVSGVLELDDALRLVAARGRLMEQMPPGTMLSVPLGEDELRERLAGRDGLWLAAVNAPSLCVVSGHADRIEAFSHKLADSGIDTRRLHTSHAFHSGLMQEAVEPFVEIAGEIEFGTPRIPYLSNVTGDWITEADVSDPSYWGRHIRDAVRFADGIGRILTETDHVLLEVGPGQVLGSIARQHPDCGRDRLIVPSLRHPQSDVDDASFLMGALGRLWTGGIEVDWSRFHGPGRRRVPLPTYPFQRERYWIEAGRPQQAATRPSLRDWFYVPGWRHTPPVVADPESAPAAFPVLVFADASPLSKQVVADLRRAGGAVTVVEAGDAFAQMDDRFVISAEQTEDYGRLVTELVSADGRPPRVIHLWNATAEEGWLDDAEAARRAELGFYSVLYLARALGEAGGAEPVHMDVVTTGVHEVTGEDVVQPEKALVLGPGRVMGREFSDITCRVIDLAAREIAVGEDALGETLLAEIRSRPDHPEVAYRAGRRYVQRLGRVPLEAVRSDQPARLRAGGTYLITGGLGGIGLEIAKYLAQAVKANLVLTARTPLPERDAWIDHLAAHGEDDTISRRIRAVIAVEEAGGQVMVAAADTADRTAMQEVVAEATRRFGPINGVVHSAGVPGGGVILLKQREEAARVLRPKVDGSRVLYDIFGGSELDFMVLCSSVTSILGNAGQVDYCAANAYQDCFARRFAADTGTFTVAVNWGRWREVGMAVEAAQVSGHRGPLTGASNAEGIEAFRRVLDAGVQPQVAVFDEDMVAALDRTAADEPTDRDGEEAGRDDRADASTATGYARPRLASEYAPPETDLERAIAEIWEQILGIEGIGRHDDFFELGGHSLIATRIVSRLREMIDVDVSLRAALEHKTIATLAASLDAPASSTTLPPIVPIARDSKDKIPLSSAQRRLWFLDQLGASTGYNLGLSLRYDGRLDIDRLRETFAAMTDRHEVLRTSFPDDGGHAYQRIVDAVEIPIRVVDVAHLTSEAGVAEAHRTAGVEFLRPFDLAEGPLLRAAVVRMRDGDVLIITVHHIVSDAWSVPLFRREIVDRYDLLSRGIEPDFPPLPVQYADFAAWQNTWFDDAALRSQMDYWTAQLGGELPVLELPTDRPRPPLQTFNGASRRITFTPELFDDIRGFARDRGVTTAMVMLAAFKVLLSRYTGLEDVVVGSPIAGRTRTEIEDLIGFFVNTLVMRTDLSGEPSFNTVVERVKRVALEAYEHQDLPFERLVDQLDPERDLRHNPLFQVAFVMNTVDTAAATDTGFTNLSTDVTVTRTDIELYLFEHPAAMGGTLVYNTDLFDGATIERMLEHYLRLLESALDDPAAPITTLPMLSDAERTEVLDTWNATDAPFAADRCIHELFEDRVDEAPDALALVFEDTQLTYGQLEARANRIAHVLREMGVGRDVMVGLCVDRGLDMIAGLLGILKAGGAYVPIDAAYPRDRIAFMLEDSQAPVLVTQSHLLETFPETGAGVLWLDTDAERIDAAPDTRPELITTADDLAYVIYTSGSTGQPKAALLPHRGLCKVSEAQRRAFDVTPADLVLQFSSLSFDACTFDVVMALPKGATLYLGHRNTLLPGPDLLGFLRRHAISIVTLPPSALAALPAEPLPDLKTITVAGEVCPEALVSRWAPGRSFFNLYGPTEATIWSTMAELQATGDAPHIGRPIGNTRIYVLDQRMRPVPVGVPGELYIAGVGLARGYHRRPGMTAERFVPDPFGDLPGARLYRTGDRARYRPDGTIEFLGRIDFQVKVRGFRIEPGEVEVTATLHPEVQHAVAVAREDTSGGGKLVLYIVAADPSLSTISLREFMRERLPEYMVPSAVVVLDAFPLTPSGKIDRRALPAPSGDLGSKDVYIAPRSDLEERIAAIWRDLLLLESVGVTDNFFDVGGHSLLLVKVHARLQKELGPDIAGALSVSDLFQHPTVSALAHRLTDGEATPVSVAETRRMTHGRRAGDNAIAVIGMAGRFPGAPDVETLWRNLRSGVESVRFFTDDEMREHGVDDPILRDPHFVKASAVLDDADCFDAWFFGYTPREAELIDPQQRIFLECAWEGLERAGYDPRRYARMIGVYAGASMSSYLVNVQSHPELVRAAGGLQLVISNDKDFLATRVSYKLDLRGPSVSVQTACSTSLVAVHEACQALLEQRCDIALAGGVSVSVPLVAGHMYREGSILSPDGHCRAFDANARGTLVGNGAGVVVLKPLDAAIADGDRIHAVIRGTAVNNDGANKVGYTAPSVEGQAKVIALAQAAAGIESDTVTYIEAHGTGTPLGDPIEVAALRKVFEQKTDRKGFCGIGSLKTNIGHLDAAAGVAGLIKTVLALEHRELPPSLHFETPNPEIDFASSPFYVARELRPWKCDDGQPRRAGVSSFGMGGTNAHAIVEESPLLAASGPSRDAQLLVLSAKSEPALESMATNLAAHLAPSVEAAPAPVLADVAYTLQVGRSEFEHRRAISCHTTNEAVAALAGERREAVWTGHAPAGGRQVAFMFPGQGAQYVNMGLGLYRTEAVFRRTVERCFDTLLREASLDLLSMLYPDGEPEGDATECLMRTAVAQPALFTVQYALARLWQSWGVEPEACIGHSIGEFTAACISGVLEVDDALRLVALRGQLMEQMPEGAMLAVPVAEPRAREILDGADGLWLSAVNSPSVTVVSGGHEAVDVLSRRLAAAGLECRLLHTSHAFHSGLMDGAVAPFVEAVRSVRRSAARIPYISNVTGDWISAAEIEDPSYWGRHIREPVRFSTGLEKLLAHPERILLEVGPGGVLGTLARQHRSCGRDRVVVPSLGHSKDETSDELFITRALGRLWAGGASVDWSSYHAGERRRRVVLPTYPFARERYWIEPRRDEARRDGPGAKSHEIERWLYVPGWKTSISKRRPLVSNAEVEPGSWVLFLDECGMACSLADRLRHRGDRVITVTRGERFRIESEQSYAIAPERQGDYIAFATEMRTHGFVPDGIVHAWGLGGADREEGVRICAAPDTSGFYSLLYLAQALGASGELEHLRLKVLCSNLFRVDSGDDVDAARSLLLGPARVIPLEYPNVSCGLFDIEAPGAEQSPDSELVDALFTELDARESAVVAFRRGARWCPHYEQVQVDLSRNDCPDRYVGGSYLITGGLTDPGLSFAEHLVSRGAKGLLLVDEDDGRSGRNRYGSATGRVDAVEVDRSRLEAVEQACELVVATCGWHDSEVLEEVVAEAEGVLGEIRGVIHAAAVDGEGLIQMKPQDAVERVLAPRVSGTLSIERVFHRRPLDFLVLFGSSLSATGMFGQVDGCAGSAYLGGFAESQVASSDRLTLAMEWPVWLGPADTGGAQIKDDLMQSVVGQYREAHGITYEQGVKIFEQALAERVPRIVVARSDLNALVRDSLTFSLSSFAQATSRSGKSLVRHQRPEISEAFVAPRGEIETTIAELWEELFGFKPVGVTDDFFELGGNSLLAIQLTARLRETFRTEIPLSVVFEDPTVREMALSISLAEQDEGAELAAMLSEIASLSPEEVKAELAAEQGQNDGDGFGH